MVLFEPIEVEWRIYMSVTYDINNSDNDLSSVRRQAIIRTNVEEPFGTNCNEYLIYSHPNWDQLNTE